MIRPRDIVSVEGLFVLINGRLWTKGKIRGRTKFCEVTICQRQLCPDDEAYRPIREGEGVVRYMRLCVLCVEGDPNRCKVTGNPVGTDTWEANSTCPCEPCQRYVNA